MSSLAEQRYLSCQRALVIGRDLIAQNRETSIQIFNQKVLPNIGFEPKATVLPTKPRRLCISMQIFFIIKSKFLLLIIRLFKIT